MKLELLDNIEILIPELKQNFQFWTKPDFAFLDEFETCIPGYKLKFLDEHP